MAASVSFKQQCPSCEAQVPVRDAKLVGKKIECPKCKFSFVVEAPKTDDDKDEAKEPAKAEAKAPAKKDKGSDSKVTNAKPANGKAANGKAPAKPAPAAKSGKPAAKKAKSDGGAKAKAGGRSMTLILGISVGAVAVVGLIVGVVIFVVFGSKSGNSGKSNAPASAANAPAKPGANTQAANNPNNAPAKDKDKETEKDTEKGPKTDPVPSAVTDISNLLPNKTETVVSVNVPLLRSSSIRNMALETPGAFQDANFRKSFGFSSRDVQRIILAYQAEPANGFFSVMRTANAIPRDELVASLKLEGPTEVNDLGMYAIRKHLDGLSNLIVKGNLPQDAYLHFVDDRTLVFANKPVMDQFLSEKARPKFLTDAPTAAPSPDKTKPGGKTPPGSQSNPMPMEQPNKTTTPMPTPTPMPMPMPRRSERKEKTSFDAPAPRTEEGEAEGEVEVVAEEPEYQFVFYQPPGGFRGPGGKGQGPMPGAPYGRPPGTNPNPNANQPPPPEITTSYMTVQPALKNALDKVENAEKPSLVVIATLGHSKLAHEIGRRFFDAIPSGDVGEHSSKELKGKTPPFHGVKVMAFSIRSLTESKLTAVAALEGRDEQSSTKLEETVRFFGELFPLLVSSTLGLEVSGIAPQQPNNVQPGQQPGFGGKFAPMPMPGGGQTPPENPEGRDGSLALYKYDGVLVLNLELNLKEPAYDFIKEKAKEFFIQLKGYAELAHTGSRIHELAAALQAYVKDKGAFPRGTVERKADGARRLSFAPQTRLSWMVELLPYLDEGNYRSVVFNPKAAWWDSPNFLAAQMIVPQFLARTQAGQPASVRYGSIATPVGATDFVGIAGLGYDAANYRADDPKVADKLGVFGYDRVTKVADVKGGLDKTIVLIQVPMSHPAPWIAGGGSTVRGVSDDKLDASAIAPFVCAQYDGKEGTFAIMGDFKVRFLPKTMSNDVFRALCTINGPKPIGDLDKIAPEVPPTDGATELKTKPLAGGNKPSPIPDAPAPLTPVNAEKKDWKEQVSKEGHFSILMPNTAQQPTLTQEKDPFGPIDLMQQVANDMGTKTAYITMYGDLPANEAAKGPDAVFQKLRDHLLKLAKGKASGESKVSLGTVPGIEFRFDGTDAKNPSIPKKGILRIYLAKNRIYILLAATENAQVPEQDAKQFMDSFKFTDAAAKP